MATDYAINENLVAAGFTLPEGSLHDSQYYEMEAEKIYKLLPEDPQDKPQDGDGKDGDDKSSSNDPGRCGEVLPAKDEKESKTQQEKWKAAVSQAIQISKGKIPGNIKRQLDEVLNPPLPWHVLLRDFVEKTARNDYDWTRPSRRYLNRGLILPSLVSEELPEIVIAVDTSGSIDTNALNRFAAEASSVLGAYDTVVRVLYCDTKVQGEEVFTKEDMPMKMNPVGGGGTRFTPVFQHVDKNGWAPACLIYFTDMYGSFPESDPGYPVMWITATKNKKAPFGETVLFND